MKVIKQNEAETLQMGGTLVVIENMIEAVSDGIKQKTIKQEEVTQSYTLNTATQIYIKTMLMNIKRQIQTIFRENYQTNSTAKFFSRAIGPKRHLQNFPSNNCRIIFLSTIHEAFTSRIIQMQFTNQISANLKEWK